MFGDLFLQSVVFSDLVEYKKRNWGYEVFTAQPSIQKLEVVSPTNKVTPNLPEKSILMDLIAEPPELKADFQKLYDDLTKLLELGMCLDISFRKNCFVCKTHNNGKTTYRLKIYDTIPLLVHNLDKFDDFKEQNPEIGSSLVTYKPNTNSSFLAESLSLYKDFLAPLFKSKN